MADRFRPEDDAIEQPMFDPTDLITLAPVGKLASKGISAALKSQILKKLLAKKVAQEEAVPLVDLAAKKAQVPLDQFRKTLNPDVYALQTEGAVAPSILEADKAGNSAIRGIDRLDALRRKFGTNDIDPGILEEITKKIKN